MHFYTQHHRVNSDLKRIDACRFHSWTSQISFNGRDEMREFVENRHTFSIIPPSTLLLMILIAFTRITTMSTSIDDTFHSPGAVLVACMSHRLIQLLFPGSRHIPYSATSCRQPQGQFYRFHCFNGYDSTSCKHQNNSFSVYQAIDFASSPGISSASRRIATRPRA